MSRQLYQIERSIERINAQLAAERTQRAFLLTTYSGTVVQGAQKVVLISFSDPLSGTRGTTMRALIRPGLAIDAAAYGSPVAVRIRHGKAEILSFG